MSFRETREMLLLAYDGKIISDEEFLVLWESCRSKNPDFPYSSSARFDLENIHETECLAEFRVQKEDIPVLANNSTASPLLLRLFLALPPADSFDFFFRGHAFHGFLSDFFSCLFII
ncbi:unnamed protein product [Pocillopora meandrina]|uniref:Uncharacterized protein n=1 Tax=Pocillopora meandrina TaxID=46732 RepID=A0AAU9VYS6_9CNID|nr:unnamed protein product [Pocillopora meandrina]